MRELSVEEKAKAYDEAIKRASKLRVQNPFDTVSQMMEHVFPELKESEDEKIRKTLKHYLEVRRCQTQSDEEYINCNNFLAWLEKQGKEDSSIQQAYEWGYTEGKRIERKHWIEKQNFSEDYNSIDPQFGKPINKVEPKFKDGDVLCYKDEISLYKHDIKNCTKQETTFGGFVYHCCYDGKRFITDSLYSLTEQDKMDIHPATKEQRDLLFSKMKEAGYTFDFEKKELKKIEQPELTEFEEAVKDMIDDYRDAIDAHAATTEEVKERAAYMLSLIPHKSAEWSEEDEKKQKKNY